MARRAARLERAGALTPRDRMWAAIRALAATDDTLGGCKLFSPIEVQFLANLRMAVESHVHVDSVADYLQALTKAAPPYVELCEDMRPGGRRRAELTLYFLKRDVGVEAPRVNKDGKPVTEGLAADQMWAAMKALRAFDAVELAAAATTPAFTVRKQTARLYLWHLARADYVTRVAEAKGTQARYRFNRGKNTGPRAPLVCRDKSVMDANNGTVWRPEGESECKT